MQQRYDNFYSTDSNSSLGSSRVIVSDPCKSSWVYRRVELHCSPGQYSAVN
jgi:hypothetical protein